MRLIVFGLCLSAVVACGNRDAVPEAAPPTASSSAESPTAASAADPLVGKVWTLSPGDGRPGVIRVFLPDGTLLQDSCFETFRLSEWRRVGGNRIAWNEDGVDIEAEIVAASDEALTLKLLLVAGEEKAETYRASEVPFVCPDMPR